MSSSPSTPRRVPPGGFSSISFVEEPLEIRKPRTPVGGRQTFSFQDEPLASRSIGTPGLLRTRSAKKMNCDSPNRSSMKNLLECSDEPSSPRRNNHRLSPGGKTSIEQCFQFV